MTTLEQLREKVFSRFHKDSWEIKSLGEIALEIISGNEITRAQLGTGDFPAIKCGDINSSLPQQFKECISFVDPSLIKKPKYFKRGDVLISKMSNKTSTVGTAATYLGEGKVLLGGDIDAIRHSQNSKFLAYVLSIPYVRRQIENFAQESTVFHLYTKDIKKLKIPLPPIEIQNQISDFLDKFSELERNLKIEWEKESEKRKDQYEYYRELLFNRGLEEHKWPIKTIEDIASEIISGNEITKAQLGTGDHPALRFKQIHDSQIEIRECLGFVNGDLVKNKRYAERGDIVITQISENLEEAGKACVYLGEQRCLVGNHITVIRSRQNTRYLTYYLSTEFAKGQIKELCQKSIVFEIYKNKIKQIKVPVPSLEEQERIVEILDRLHGIVHDFKEGIPFLIRRNRKQYEFYRELLLVK